MIAEGDARTPAHGGQAVRTPKAGAKQMRRSRWISHEVLDSRSLSELEHRFEQSSLNAFAKSSACNKNPYMPQFAPSGLKIRACVKIAERALPSPKLSHQTASVDARSSFAMVSEPNLRDSRK